MGVAAVGAAPRPIPAKRFRRRLLWGGVGAAAGWIVLGGPLAAAVVAGVAVWAAESQLRTVAAAARRRFQDGLEGAVETMVASLRAGQGLVQAVEEAQRQASEPVRGALSAALTTYRAGTPLTEALSLMTRDWPLSEVSYLVACLDTHIRTGGDVTVLLVNLSGLIRERRHLCMELLGRSSEARSTARMLALLPPGLLTYILLVEPSQLEPLLSSPVGVFASAFAGVSWAAGVVFVQRLIGGVTRSIEEEG
jgi:tight adherence protein B